MPRTAICIFCALLASIVAALLLLSPSPSAAEEKPELPSAVTMGGDLQEGAKPLAVTLSLKMLGTEQPIPGFKLLLLAKYKDAPHENAACAADEAGKVAVALNRKPTELRAFAYGDYVIPDGWSNIPVGTMKFDGEEAWTLFVRPLKRVRVHGKISVAGHDKPPQRANVSFAPLDVSQDGTTKLFDQPHTVLTDERGEYELELPIGYYQAWSYWTDRSDHLADWVGYIKVEDKVSVLGDTELNLVLRQGPQLRGRVVDARTGEGMAASIDIYTNIYLRQLRLHAADGRVPDDYEGEDTPIYWPVGTFDFQAWMVDPNNFTVVIKPQGSESVIRVFPDRSAADFAGQDVVWELYTDDMRRAELTVLTEDQGLPMLNLDVRLLPRLIDAPAHVRQSYTASATTDESGKTVFLGLAPGTYEAFGAGSTLLGELTISEEKSQQHELRFAIPFVFGSVALPDSTVCRNMTVFVTMTNQGGREFGPFPSDGFKDNPRLKERGTVFVPLLSFGSTFRLQFAAMEGGKAYGDNEWVGIEHFPLITEEVEFKVDEEKGWKVDLKLKPNPDYEKFKGR